MSTKLFHSVAEGHDGKGRIVHLCEDAYGFYVYKPATGFRTRHWKSKDSKALVACFNRQVVCTQNTGFFEKGEAPAADEKYSLEAEKKKSAPAAQNPPAPPADNANGQEGGAGAEGQQPE